MNREKFWLLVVIILILLVFIGCGSIPTYDVENRYNVVNVIKYTATQRIGWNQSDYIAYAFTYVDSDGSLVDVNDFTNTSNGLTSVRLGDKNEYVIYTDGLDTFEILYLTEHTMNTL